jgi:hypothetical protein
MWESKKPCIVVHEMLKQCSDGRGSPDFQNGDKNALIRVGIL